MSFRNPGDAKIRQILEQADTIAVVGLSPKPNRPSHRVARRLQEFGYHIVPVRPVITEVLGEKAYGGLKEVPEPVDIVDVFRAPQYIDAIVDVCIERRFPVLWLQEGVVNESAARRAQEAGITVVMDRCTLKEHVRLLG
ncbi:MAG: CoA-binding protein [Acidiferrobacteraceae bacterium]|jgi:predicted CoA-binding protein